MDQTIILTLPSNCCISACLGKCFVLPYISYFLHIHRVWQWIHKPSILVQYSNRKRQKVWISFLFCASSCIGLFCFVQPHLLCHITCKGSYAMSAINDNIISQSLTNQNVICFPGNKISWKCLQIIIFRIFCLKNLVRWKFSCPAKIFVCNVQLGSGFCHVLCAYAAPIKEGTSLDSSISCCIL